VQPRVSLAGTRRVSVQSGGPLGGDFVPGQGEGRWRPDPKFWGESVGGGGRRS
jgi:hypothetical protein